MLQKLNWMLISEIENEITNVLLRSDVYGEFVCHFVKLLALSTKLSARKLIWSIENEVEFLKMKLSERKWNWMPENEITCIFFEIDTGMSTSNQFRCEIERPFTNLNEISTKLARKTYSTLPYSTYHFTLKYRFSRWKMMHKIRTRQSVGRIEDRPPIRTMMLISFSV